MDPITEVGGSSTFSGPGGLGKEDFLRLLVTQLQYQDPLDPLDAQDFASQLAEFTAMEQQLLTNELLEAQIEMNQASMIESQNSVAIGMIGSGIVADGNRVQITGSGDAAWVASSGATSLRVDLLDSVGGRVATLNTSVDGEGIHRIDLAEATAGLPPGQYTLSVESLAGEEGITVSPLSSGVVQGVRWSPSGPVLVVGSEEVPLVNVLEITSQEPYQP